MRVLGWLLPSLMLSACHAAGTTEAVWGRDGRLTLQHEGAVLATANAGLFEAGWVGHEAAADRAATVTGSQRGMKITTGKGEVKVVGSADAVAGGLRLIYRFTPPQPVPVNSVHVAWTLPVAAWTGGKYAVDGGGGSFPVTFGQAGLYSGASRKLVLTSPKGFVLTFAATTPVNFLVQDDRQWGTQSFAIRAIGLSGDGKSFAEPVDIALELSSEPAMSLVNDEPVTLQAGADWVALPPTVDVQPGSALDLRSAGLLDAPAGKHGQVIARNGHLALAQQPDRAVRFYGVNLCFSALYLDKAVADRVADRLAMNGYNSLRIHHYESGLMQGGRADSLTFNEASLDKLEYLIAACKQRGIYLTTDLFVSRSVKPAETIDGGADMNGYKLAVLVDSKSRDNLKAFARLLLGHVNPYTHTALKDDPALACLSLVNEGTAGNYLGSLKGELKRVFGERYNAWRAQRGLAPAALPSSLGGPETREAAQFLAQVQIDFYADMQRFLRDELGCHALLTDMNAWTENWPNQVARSHFDYVDNHGYWDHPSFLERDWSLPSRGWSGGLSATAQGGALHRDRAITRLLDRPFGFTEFNFAQPNGFRAESGPLMGAYAALQGWDGVWRFAYSHDARSLAAPQASNYFDVATDPSQQASDRFAALLFLRDVAPAKTTVAVTVSAAEAMSGKAPLAALGALNRLSYVSRLGSRVDPPAAVAGAGEVRVAATAPVGPEPEQQVLNQLKAHGLPADNATDLAHNVFVSDTGQLRLDQTAGLFSFDTPRSVGIFSAFGKAATAGLLTIGASQSAIGVYVASLGDQPVVSAPRLLLAHVPDIQATGRQFGERALHTLLGWGQLPLLARDVATAVTLRLAQPEACHVQALGLDGAALGPVAAHVQDGALVIPARTRFQGQGVIYYEIRR